MSVTSSAGPGPAEALAYRQDLAADPAAADSLARVRALVPTPRTRLRRVHRAGRLLYRLRPARPRHTRWVDALAARLGWDRSETYKVIRLGRRLTPAQARDLQRAGVTWSHAAAALKLRDAGMMVDLLLAAAGQGWSVRQVQDYLRFVPADHPGPLRLPAAPVDDPDVLRRAFYRHARPLVDHILPALRDDGRTETDPALCGLLAARAAGVRSLSDGGDPVGPRPADHDLLPPACAST